MTLERDLNTYETPWRVNYEARQVLLGLTGALFFELWGWAQFSTFVPSLHAHLFALFFLALAVFPLPAAVSLFRLQLALAGRAPKFLTFAQLQKQMRPHPEDWWLGLGFSWEPRHAQLVYDLLRRDWQSVADSVLDPVRRIRFLARHAALVVRHPWKARTMYLAGLNTIERKGVTWIHGVGALEEKDVYQPLSHTGGHTLVIGTTGAGKTRCFDLLISQAILHGETVIIIDPKGDQDLAHKAERACKALGRGDSFYYFRPSEPERSMRINLLANWGRATEIASRIANLIPSQGASDPFKNFAWDALNKVSQGLCMAHKKPTLKDLRRYLSLDPHFMVVQSLLTWYEGQKGSPTVDKLLLTVRSILYRDPTGTDRDAAPPAKAVEAAARVFEEYYTAHGPKNAEVDGLFDLMNHDREHFGKMITSVMPVLSMLTSGDLGDMLSPTAEEDIAPEELVSAERFQYQNTLRLLQANAVVYLGLNNLTDAMVGGAIGSLFLADLTSSAGFRYNAGQWDHPVNLFVDEAAEVINDSLIQLLNKGRGAGFRLFVATQTVADFSARMASKEKAMQILGNLNNTLSLRCIDPDTSKFVSNRFPQTSVQTLARDTAVSLNAGSVFSSGTRVGERVSQTEAALFPPELLGMLPDLEYIANLSGGRVIKGRLPLLLDQ